MEGDVLARILDPYDCHVLQEVAAPRQVTIFFAHSRPLTLEHSILFKLLCS
ncbi:MAG: hypothetical protein MR627_02240 [Prevotella sp.]|nr:hypothetical protein [Prevotella sp.]